MHSAHRATATLVAAAALGLLGAPAAGAEPVEPGQPGEPAGLILPEAAEAVAALPAALPADAAEGVPHYEGVPHLPSPNSPPPGTSTTPPPQRALDGLRDIWDAVQNDEITGGDALLLMITQRPRGKVPAEQMSPRPADPIMFAQTPPAPGAPAPAPDPAAAPTEAPEAPAEPEPEPGEPTLLLPAP
jgi:hypothetical protein